MENERFERTRKAMAKEGFDALVCRLPEDVLFLTGHWPLSGITWLFFPLEGTPVCIAPQVEEREARDDLDALGGAGRPAEARIELRVYPHGNLSAPDPRASVVSALRDVSRGKRLRRIGFEGSFDMVAPPWNVSEPVTGSGYSEGILAEAWGRRPLRDATGLLSALRVRKTAPEADRIRRSNEIACFGLQAFQESVVPGATGADLVAAVEAAIMTKGTGHRGARRVRAFAQVATGTQETALGARPMEISTKRRLAAGDLALLELGVVADGYWSDRTRVRVAGAPTARQVEIFSLVRSAQEAAVRAVRPGAAAGAVDAAARSLLESAGLGKEFFHSTGHGTGFRYHEPGSFLAPGSSTILEEGMVFSVEPGVYSDRIGGMRLEDNVLVTAQGAEVLGPFVKELAIGLATERSG